MNLYAIHTSYGIYILELASDQEASDHANDEDVYIGYDRIKEIGRKWYYHFNGLWYVHLDQEKVENAYASFLEVKNYKENKEKS